MDLILEFFVLAPHLVTICLEFVAVFSESVAITVKVIDSLLIDVLNRCHCISFSLLLGCLDCKQPATSSSSEERQNWDDVFLHDVVFKLTDRMADNGQRETSASLHIDMDSDHVSLSINSYMTPACQSLVSQRAVNSASVILSKVMSTSFSPSSAMHLLTSAA